MRSEHFANSLSDRWLENKKASSSNEVHTPDAQDGPTAKRYKIADGKGNMIEQ